MGGGFGGATDDATASLLMTFDCLIGEMVNGFLSGTQQWSINGSVTVRAAAVSVALLLVVRAAATALPTD